MPFLLGKSFNSFGLWLALVSCSPPPCAATGSLKEVSKVNIVVALVKFWILTVFAYHLAIKRTRYSARERFICFVSFLLIYDLLSVETVAPW